MQYDAPSEEALRRLNALTIDVEAFVEANIQSFQIDSKLQDIVLQNREVERNMECLLAICQQLGLTATFFFLGRVAEDLPHIVRAAADAGHEIACHSYQHLRLTGIATKSFKTLMSSSKKLLEDVSGQQVWGFRAPDFSITTGSLWALDALQEAGFLYDSSIYPIGFHDVYGIKDQHQTIHELPNGLIEFPLSSASIGHRRLPFGGGGYFRLYPLWLTTLLIGRTNRAGHPAIVYLHPYEVGPDIPLIPELSLYRRFRHYYNCGNGAMRMVKLLSSFRFGTVMDVLREENFLGDHHRTAQE
jgi:polysaccharide deacetylase family protein (PEP-CTERM system associated)